MNVTLQNNQFTTRFTKHLPGVGGLTMTIAQDIYDGLFTGQIEFGPLFIEIGGRGLPRTYIKSAILECFYESQREDAETILNDLFESIDRYYATHGCT